MPSGVLLKAAVYNESQDTWREKWGLRKWLFGWELVVICLCLPDRGKEGEKEDQDKKADR